MKLRKILACALVVCMATSFTACKQLDEVTNVLNSDGREQGKTIEGEMGKALKNEFFEYTLHSVEKVAEFEGEAPQIEGHVFLIAEVEVKNVSSNSVPMFSTDFEIQWGDGENEWDYCYEKFTEKQMADEYELAIGKSTKGQLIYEVPASATSLGLRYVEVYEDDFVGNEYIINFTAPAIEASPKAGTQKPSSGQTFNGKIGETMTNEFFSFVVNSAVAAKEYKGLKPSADNQFVVVDISIKNVFGETIPMYNSDFIVDWGEGDEDYNLPLEKSKNEQLPDEFDLAVDEEAKGILVFEVPLTAKEVTFSYLEVYKDDSFGNMYFVPITLSAAA